MKILIVTLLLISNTFSQGKFAGEFKSIIGTKYITEKDIPQLKNFSYNGGSIISDLEFLDAYYLSLEVFRKGTTAIVIMSKLVDKTTNQHSIIEVLKIIDVPKNYEIRISDCTSNSVNPDDKIVAVYYLGHKKKVKLIKEAFVLKDIRFEKLSTKKINCINEN